MFCSYPVPAIIRFCRPFCLFFPLCHFLMATKKEERVVSAELEEDIVAKVSNALGLPSKNITLGKRVIGWALGSSNPQAFAAKCNELGSFQDQFLQTLYERILTDHTNSASNVASSGTVGGGAFTAAHKLAGHVIKGGLLTRHTVKKEPTDSKNGDAATDADAGDTAPKKSLLGLDALAEQKRAEKLAKEEVMKHEFRKRGGLAGRSKKKNKKLGGSSMIKYEDEDEEEEEVEFHFTTRAERRGRTTRVKREDDDQEDTKKHTSSHRSRRYDRHRRSRSRSPRRNGGGGGGGGGRRWDRDDSGRYHGHRRYRRRSRSRSRDRDSHYGRGGGDKSGSLKGRWGSSNRPPDSKHSKYSDNQLTSKLEPRRYGSSRNQEKIKHKQTIDPREQERLDREQERLWYMMDETGVLMCVVVCAGWC